MRFDTLDPDVRQRFAALRALLGEEEAVAAKSRMTEEQMIGILANGLNITEQEAVDFLLTLLGLEEEPEEAFVAATKSHVGPGRDSYGRRIKPQPEAARRDSQGRRINKPNDPRRFDSQRRTTDAGGSA